MSPVPNDLKAGASRRPEPGLPEIHTQLRIANRLAAAQLKHTMGQQELVRLLAGTGASNVEIADTLGTTPATIGVTLQRLKKGGAKNTKADDADDAPPSTSEPTES
jgi:DNA-binding CsgD family transcriptional regulator